MGIFNKKVNNLNNRKRKFIYDVRLQNGEYISVISIENDQTVKHSDARQRIIKIMGISHPYKRGEAMKLDASKYIAFEVAPKQQIDSNCLLNAVQKYLSNGNNHEICQYVGEYNNESKKMDRYSKTIENYVRQTICTKLQNRNIQSQNKDGRSFREKLVLQPDDRTRNIIEQKAGAESNIQRMERNRMERLKKPFLKDKGNININGRTLYSYDGVNLANGEVLRIRHLDKVGKDGSGTYLYAGYIQQVAEEGKYEVLGQGMPLGAYVCFETKSRIEDIIKDGKQESINQLLELLSSKDNNSYRNDGTLHYIGELKENGNISRKPCSDSPSIRRIIETMQKQYMQKMHNIENEMYK